LVSDLDYKNKLNIAIEDGSAQFPTNFIAYDLLLWTPSKLFNEKTLLNQTALGLNPEVVVFDEFDIWFTGAGLKYQSVNILDLFLSKYLHKPISLI